MRLLVATSNEHKLREIHGILAGVPVELLSLAAFPDVEAPAETGATFADNARQKAIYYAVASGLVAVAEDSGLEIDGLDGDPGVHSARFGGFVDDYARKFVIIYDRLRAGGAADSPARFVCALAVARGRQLLFEARGVIEGHVAPQPTGQAPIRSHSGLGPVNGAQGELSARVKSPAAGSQNCGSSQMFPLTPYCPAIPPTQSPPGLPHRSQQVRATIPPT